MLKTVTPQYLEAAKTEYVNRRDATVAALKRLDGVTAHSPQGGFYLVTQLPVEDAEAFAVFMLKEFSYKGATTFVAPAAGFYMHRDAGKTAIRIAFVLESAEIERGIEALGEGLKAYKMSHE
jgi:aspartate aminotransferase